MTRQGVYRYLAQERVHFGKPAADAVMEEAELHGATRVLIVSGKTLTHKTDVISTVEQALGDRHSGTFHRTVEHTPRASVLDLLGEIREHSPDLIVTIGGGTAIDTVKVALVGLAEDVTEPDELEPYYIRVGAGGTLTIPDVASPPVRQIVVPTTLSGAEFSAIGAAVDEATNIKHLCTGREICGEAVILDPAATVYTPEWLWLSTGMRSVDHAVESLCSKAPQPLPDSTGVGALRLLSDSLRATKQDPADLDARLDSQMGVWLATTGLGRVPWGASHGIGHQLGAVANVPHGYCTCVMLPSVLAYNLEVTAAQQTTVADALGRPDMAAGDAVRELIEDLGLPSRLRDVGVTREQFDAIAEGSVHNVFVSQNPRPIEGPEQIMEILEMAW